MIKATVIILSALAMSMFSCTSEQKKELSGNDLFVKGNCQTCHLAEQKSIGPSIAEIKSGYNGNASQLESFLTEKSGAIIDPEKYPLMQSNLHYTKSLEEDELKLLVNFMLK